MSGCCRIDPIHHGGIYIPLLAPVFRCLPLPLSFFLSLRCPSRAHSRTTAGMVSPVRPLMPPLSWGRLRKLPFPPLPAITPSLQLPGPPRHPLFSSYRSKMQRPLSTRQIFSPPAQRHSTRGRSEERSFTRFLELPIVRSRASTIAMCSKRLLRSLDARERRSREIFPLAS